MNTKFLSPLVPIVLVSVALAGCSQISDRHEPQASAVQQQLASVAAPPQGSAGMTTYRDPITGRFMPVAQNGLAPPLSKELSNAMSMSQEGLIEIPAPGGGFMVDLRGRFQQATEATINANGTATVHCGQHQAPEKD